MKQLQRVDGSTKICTRCGEFKAYSFFRQKKGVKVNKDGYNSTCKKCDAEIQAEYRQKKKDENPLIYCDRCKLFKHYSLYYSNRKSHNNGVNICIDCVVCIDKEKKKDKRRVKYNELKQRMCANCGEFKDVNSFNKSNNLIEGRDLYRSWCKACERDNRIKNDDEQKKRIQKWHRENREYMLEYQRNYNKLRRKNDPIYRLRKNIQSAVLHSIKKYANNNAKVKNLQKEIFKRL